MEITKLPKGLEEKLKFYENYYNELKDKPDQQELCEKVKKGVRYLRAIRELYVKCTGCNDPDPERLWEIDDEYFCSKCAEEVQ